MKSLKLNVCSDWKRVIARGLIPPSVRLTGDRAGGGACLVPRSSAGTTPAGRFMLVPRIRYYRRFVAAVSVSDLIISRNANSKQNIINGVTVCTRNISGSITELKPAARGQETNRTPL